MKNHLCSFNYMAISDTRQRNMPSASERAKGQKLAYPEAIRITNSSNPQFVGEVDDKYQYSCENQDNILQGWIAHYSKQTVGIWMITPSNEFRNGGPVHQDLTSHVGPTLLNVSSSSLFRNLLCIWNNILLIYHYIINLRVILF
ncbi:unnamed protein product [Lupinus luteus]|uniref:Neprosin domain-containing protein n=1 Tax=Lupinus luteus TaxID=3873 RepID=A0AAV1YCM3_LUPLU